MGNFEVLVSNLSGDRERLLRHPIYFAVSTPSALRAFMSAHVFAVWDFMSLLKALQCRLTCVSIPWSPPRSRTAARLVNEIVLGEESDEVGPGVTMSHFELYLEAMHEIRADTSPVTDFLGALERGLPIAQALTDARVPSFVRAFVENTMAVATGSAPEAMAAAFLLGREDLVPAMFRRLAPAVSQTHHTASLQRYLARHIELDEETHGPLARRLLEEVCGMNEGHWRTAADAARRALSSRIALWDGTLAYVRAGA
jgi:hypothetical protein